MRLLYSAVLVLLLPLMMVRMVLRSRRAPAYRQRLGERLGFFPAPPQDQPLIWIHAVSLGETLAARPLIERLLTELPAYRVAVTTTTPTGSAQLERLFGDRVFHVYAPWDTPGAVRRCVARLRPRLLLIMETELWPNLLHRCAAIDCPVILANARLSERSAAGYARFPGVTRDMLDSLALIAAQNAESASRFVRLGAPDERVLVTGSIKFDVCVDSQQRQQAAMLAQRWQLAARPVILAASTHEGEEALVLDAFQAQREVHSNALLVLVPRHPERFSEVHTRCVEGGWSVVRRSSAADVTQATDILLVDSIGELMMLYGLADVAVIGGSFSEAGGAPRGGHNPLEPAAWGKPILAGMSMFNFEQIAAQLVAAGALEQCSGASELAQCLVNLCGSEAERARRGAAAKSVVESNRGALEALFGEVRRAVLPELGPDSGPATQPDQGAD